MRWLLKNRGNSRLSERLRTKHSRKLNNYYKNNNKEKKSMIVKSSNKYTSNNKYYSKGYAERGLVQIGQ